eukprot:6477796-Amphidinium_carterae.1
MEEHFLEVIRHSPNTCAGPDCIPYRAYRPIARFVASVFCSLVEGFQGHAQLPDSCKEVVTVFIPKHDQAVLALGDLRPLAMLNTLGKLFAKAIAEQLSPRLPMALHEHESGFLAHRGAGHALMHLESSCFELAVEYESSVVFGLDFAAAFPSLSRPWLHSVLSATGCDGWLMAYFTELLTSLSSDVSWRCQRSSWLNITSRLLQGHPLSAILFIVATDSWTRW